MKKKIFAIYALIGAMAASPIFTSCVDSEETPSVEALRKAKAEELKAIAELNNAQAASKTAMAAADAALINARAEAQKANNRLTEARAAWYQAQNESERAELEVTIKQAEADLARIQGEIDAQAINIQAALMAAQQELMQAKKNLENATKDYDAYEKAKLQSLANDYYWAVQDLTYYQQQLAAEKSKLVKLEAGLVDAEKALEQTIAENNHAINLNNIQIEALKQYTNYTADINALKQQMDAAYNVYEVASQKYNGTYLNVNEVWNNMDATAKDAAINVVMMDDFYSLVTRKAIYDAENDEWISMEPAANYIYFSEENYYSYRYDLETEKNSYWWTYGDSLSIKYELTADIRQIELEVGNATEVLKADIKALNDAITANKTSYTAAVAATTAAKTAWDNAAEADKDAKKAEYETALNNELQLKQTIADQEEAVADLTAELAAYEKGLNILKNADTYYTALMDKVKAYNNADKAMYAAWIETLKPYILAREAYNEAWAEYVAINNIYYNSYVNGEVAILGAVVIANEIKALEEANEQLLAEIEDAQKLLTQYDGYDLPYELAIEFQKAKVAAKEAIVAAKEVKANEAKAALDAAMPAEEETPAE